jgi:hypothetical protein
MNTLKLTLNKKWFEMILSGEKTEEYREIKDHWKTRLTDQKKIWARPPHQWKFKTFDVVEFRNGYSKTAPMIRIECLGIILGNAKPEWSDNWEAMVFIIQLGEIIETKHI